MAWNENATSVLVGSSKSKRLLYNGEVSVERSITTTVVRRRWDTRVVNSIAGSYLERTNTYHDETVSTENSTETVSRWVIVPASVVSTTTEWRGSAAAHDAEASALSNYELPVISLNQDSATATQYLNINYDLITTVTKGAVTKSLILPGAVGTEVEVSARRVNEAGGWVTTVTSTTVTPGTASIN